MKSASSAFWRLVPWLTAAYWLFLFTATHVPPSQLPKTHINDKVEHIGAFGLLTGALYLSLWHKKRSTATIAITVLAIVLVYGALDELTQPFTGRTCDLYDWYADATGCLIAVTVMSIIRTINPPPTLASEPS